ncbi:unnamed protein product [Parnassius apollo]|uniref:(apollo) hypothetical protein n=1 Tax=Parnassius apollo TaxID=110799 RepID=A0A8S3Y670_PARAO|nr:unnamed protein product [Parnassius apollo]
MPSWTKVSWIVVAVAVVVGVVVGTVTWAIIGRGPSPPELRNLDWWENVVIYQIYPRSFKDTDGDGIGDLKGITSEMEHFVEAGVGAIWMSPIFTSPMIDFGYDISDFYNIHYEYGTMADFEELVSRAHELEQADFNFREPAVRQEMLNIMRFWIEKGADGFRLDAIPHLFEADPNDHGGVYPDEPLTGNMFLTSDQPGYTTQEYVRDLIELYDVVYEWRDFVDAWQEDNQAETKVLLAEAYANITMTMLYYGDERGRIGAHFPFNFDFITSLSAKSNARDFVYVINRWLTYMPRGQVANWVFGNHDNNRMPSRFRTNMVDGLNGLNMMLPGVAITYQGEEIGMRDGYVSWEDTVDVAACNQGNPDNYLEYSRDPARTPYHWNNSTSAGFSTSQSTWLPVAEDYMEINLQAQKEAERSHFKVYQSLTKLRKEPAVSHGDHHIQALSENTFVSVRHIITYDTYALVFNVGTETDTVDLSTTNLLAEPMTVYASSIFSERVPGDTIPLGEVTLQPGEALVLRAPPT